MTNPKVRVKYLKSSCCHKKGEIRPMSKSIAKVLARRGIVEILGKPTDVKKKGRKHICMSEL